MNALIRMSGDRARKQVLTVSVLATMVMLSCGGQRGPLPPMASQPRLDAERLRPRLMTRPLMVGLEIGVPSVRVGVRGATAALVTLSARGGAVFGSFRQLQFDADVGGVQVTPDDDHDARVLGDTLRCTAPAGALLTLGDRAYHGVLDVFRRVDGGLTVVNVVHLEDYLLGVVPLEIGWPGPDAIEVVKAQAIAARTYVLSHLARWPEEGFDVYGDERDQVYGGTAAEHAEISVAVRSTAGVVATYDDLLINAFYSSCCGGVQAPVEETWDLPPAPYLVSQRDRRGGPDFCRRSVHYRWEKHWTGAEVMDLLRAHYVEEFGEGRPPAPPLEDLVIESRFESGRVRTLLVRAGGRTYRLGGDRVRWVLRRGGPGGAILRSSRFELDVERQGGRVAQVTVRGFGNGHGVGMCQTGAIEMARQGFSYREILRHYYRGVELRALWAS